MALKLAINTEHFLTEKLHLDASCMTDIFTPNTPCVMWFLVRVLHDIVVHSVSLTVIKQALSLFSLSSQPWMTACLQPPGILLSILISPVETKHFSY